MGALADFAQGFFQNRAEAAQRQELARDEMSAYERKLKLQQTFQEQLEATKVAKEVPDLERGVIVMYNSKGKEIGTRQMSQAEVQSYRNSMDKESAETRRAGALASVAELEATNYEEDRKLEQESKRVQIATTRQYAANAAAANRRAEAEFQDNAGAFGPPRSRAGGALGGINLGASDLRRISEDQAIVDRIGDALVEDFRSEAPKLTPEQHSEFRALGQAIREEQDPVRKMQLLAGLRAKYGFVLQKSSGTDYDQ